jgi:hypothetical protein
MLPPTILATIDSMVSGYVAALNQMRRFTPVVAEFHVRRPEDGPAYEHFRAAVLQACARLVPPLTQLRAAIDDQLAAIEGTWQPPTN